MPSSTRARENTKYVRWLPLGIKGRAVEKVGVLVAFIWP